MKPIGNGNVLTQTRTTSNQIHVYLPFVERCFCFDCIAIIILLCFLVCWCPVAIAQMLLKLAAGRHHKPNTCYCLVVPNKSVKIDDAMKSVWNQVLRYILVGFPNAFSGIQSFHWLFISASIRFVIVRFTLVMNRVYESCI